MQSRMGSKAVNREGREDRIAKEIFVAFLQVLVLVDFLNLNRKI